MKPAETAVARQWLSSHHVVTPTERNATMESLWEAAFSERSVPMLYNADQLPKPILLSERMLCKGYDRKVSDAKNLVVILKGLSAKTN
jgi:hypothetical protein